MSSRDALMSSASPLDRTSPLDLEERQKVPRWVPVSLLAVSTAALAIPAVLLWRQKKSLAPAQNLARARPSSSNAASPPIRRKTPLVAGASASSSSQPLLGTVGGPISVPPRRSRPSVKAVEPISRHSALSESPLKSQVPKSNLRARDDGFIFDGPLQALGAFGLATAAVGLCAVLGVWGVQTFLGVKSVDEFAVRVREILLRRVPDFSRRLYRQSIPGDGPLPSSSANGTSASSSWSWDDAENRLSEAYEKGGVGAWAVSAMKEMEAEQEVERRRRGL